MNELLIYDFIGEGDSSAKAVKSALAGMTGDLIVRINSPGGDAYEGLAIMNTLRGYPGTVTAVVEGLAASAASYIAIGGAERTEIFANAEIMIHEAWGMTQGNSDQLTKDAANLNRMSDKLAKIYATKAGGTPEQWRELMRQETWFNADEAVKAGLADQIHEIRAQNPQKVFASALENYRYAGRENAPAPNLSALADNPPRKELIMGFLNKFVRAEDEEVNPVAEGTVLTADQWDRLVLALKLDPAVTVGEVVAAVEELAGATEEQITAVANQMTANAKIDRTVVVNAEVWDKMQDALKVGVTAKTQADRLLAEQAVDQAIRKGKASPTRREHWIKAFMDDPNATLKELRNAKEIPRVEAGYSKGEMRDSEDRPWVR